MKKILITAMLVSVFASTTAVYANTSSAIDRAAEYLRGAEDSAMNSIALSVIGESFEIDHLRSVNTSTAIAITKPILAIVEAGEDPRVFSDVDLVQSLKEHYDGVQLGDASAVNDDIWGILALISAGEADSVEVAGMVEFLENEQNTDGGWSWSTTGASDTDDTAMAVMALLAAGMSPSDPTIDNAVEYVRGNQNADGGFLSDPTWGTDSNSATGAWVISMIYALGDDPLTWTSGEGNSPIDHILTLQDDDGGFWWVTEGTSEWNNKNATADVVVALSGASYPTALHQTIELPESEDRDRTLVIVLIGIAALVFVLFLTKK